jgi:hypothetical protein
VSGSAWPKRCPGACCSFFCSAVEIFIVEINEPTGPNGSITAAASKVEWIDNVGRRCGKNTDFLEWNSATIVRLLIARTCLMAVLLLLVQTECNCGKMALPEFFTVGRRMTEDSRA